MHYFVNSTAEAQYADIRCGGKVLNIVTGELEPFFGQYTFPAWGSLVVIDDGTPHAVAPDPRAGSACRADACRQVGGCVRDRKCADA